MSSTVEQLEHEQAIAEIGADSGTPPNAPLARRAGPKGLLPSTWTGRGLRVEYTDASGEGQSTSGVYLDHCPIGLILNIRGSRTMVAWDRLCLVELAEG